MTTTHDPIFDKPAAYEDGDKIVYRASSLGSCTAALVRARLGVTGSAPSDLMLERFQEGHDWEHDLLVAGFGVDWVQVTMPEHLQLYGKVVQDQAGLQVETEIAWSNKVIRCHPDAIAVHRHSGERVVVEAKFFGEDLYAETLAGVEKDGMLGLGATRSWQASVEMLSTGLPMLYILGRKRVVERDGVRVVTGIDDVTCFEWQDPCWEEKDVKARVLEVEGYVARGEMPTCPVPFDYPCPYWADHEKVEAEELTDEMLVHLVESYERAVSAADRHKTEADQIKRGIDARLTEIEVDGGRCAGWDVARVSERPGNVSWSKWAEKVKKEFPGAKEIDVEEFRGKMVEGGVRMTKVKEKK